VPETRRTLVRALARTRYVRENISGDIEKHDVVLERPHRPERGPRGMACTSLRRESRGLVEPPPIVFFSGRTMQDLEVVAGRPRPMGSRAREEVRECPVVTLANLGLEEACLTPKSL
jgi:hypothetical protein